MAPIGHPRALGLGLASAFALAVDPANPSTLYTGTSFGVFKSIDSGASWISATAGLPNEITVALAIDPNTPSTLYAGTAGSIFKSIDSGGAWSSFNKGLTSGSVRGFALDPTANTTLYGAFSFGGVWQIRRSTGAFQTVPPCRALDTRTTSGPALAAGTARTFRLVGTCGIPTNAGSVAINLTATGATSGGHLRVYPRGSALPPNSSLNYSPGQTRANNTVSLLGTAGDLVVFAAQASGTVDVVIDVVGYFQ